MEQAARRRSNDRRGSDPKGRSREDLVTDRMLLFALVRAVEVVGEASSRVSAVARDERPEVPWSAIVGMRNRLVHAYFDVDTELVWKTTHVELPALRAQLQTLI